MCGRFALYADPKALQSRFKLHEAPALKPSYNIAPTQQIAGITNAEDGTRILKWYRWGLIPSWSKEIGRYSTINARAETVDTKPTYRAAFRRRRALIPASGWFEWRGNEGGKQPWFIHTRNGQILAFAGLWERWQPPDGGEPIESATIIVTSANESTQAIHDRMPAILDKGVWDRWLNPAGRDPVEDKKLLIPAPEDMLDAYPVSKRVNSPRNNDQALLNREG